MSSTLQNRAFFQHFPLLICDKLLILMKKNQVCLGDLYHVGMRTVKADCWALAEVCALPSVIPREECDICNHFSDSV